ncbi:acyl-CoA desaturase [Fontivita pretiosa]|uniref:acyl-CoA desaturase n=1 Tax=Fontivita pretiosa TaxID=2989684 RepID=UPI003D17858E
MTNPQSPVDLTTPQGDCSLAPQTLEPVSLTTRIASLIGVITPFAGFVLAVILLWGRGFGWLSGGLLLGMYVVTAFGVTIGYHRYFTHRSFQTPRLVQCILAMLGSMALQGSLLKWVATHRMHHQCSDRPGDPHSPHDHGEGFLAMLRGMWHAHMGWIFDGDPRNLYRYVPDLSRDRMLRVMSQLWLLWAAIGVILPAVIGGLITLSWSGALMGLLWGGLVRIFLVHHVTWSINSVCHLWGTRPFETHDHSRNNLVFGIVGMGEGWHNNHHAFPASARHGLRWWQIDFSYYLIRLMSIVGLAWDIRLPRRA